MQQSVSFDIATASLLSGTPNGMDVPLLATLIYAADRGHFENIGCPPNNGPALHF